VTQYGNCSFDIQTSIGSGVPASIWPSSSSESPVMKSPSAKHIGDEPSQQPPD
jgi:hypothetical protein